ncbi:MAG: long-chain fatty acid--CoA ligase [Betaproteobacteria bacterium]
MNGLMMGFPLTLTAIFRRAETLFGSQAVVTRQPDRSIVRSTYAAVADRSRRLMRALRGLGIGAGDRVATLAWNHQAHLETYFAVPAIGAVLHTLNPRLGPDELAYIVNHAEDRALIVDASLLPVYESIRPRVRIGTTIVHGGPAPDGMLDYDGEIARAAPLADLPDPAEDTAAALCYTTGTTGRPKGVLFSHRALALHSLVVPLPDALDLSERDIVLPIVPMFHANAWGLPYAGAMCGSGLAFPGPYLDPASLLEMMVAERVTIAAGVPTIWMALLQALDAAPGRYDLSAVRHLVVGGAAPPMSMIRAFRERHGLTLLHAWGMTETSPLGTVSHVPPDLVDAPADAQDRQRARQGRPVPFVEIRASTGLEMVPWDGRTMGELEVRGPWVAKGYFNDARADRFTADGWFRTGDIVTIDRRGTIEIQDRAKDLIKSGGEWISSVALENALMGHPAVAEAAIVAVSHPKWMERPLAVVVLKEGAAATAADLLAYLAPQFPKFWLPDAVEMVDAIPRTAAGKFLKSALRERFRDYVLPA